MNALPADAGCNQVRVASTPVDIIVSSTYLIKMISRLLTLLTIFAITVLTTVSSAHAAHMSTISGSNADHATHSVEMMQSFGVVEHACGAGQHCGSADAEICEFACTGLLVFLMSPNGQVRHFHKLINRAIPSDAIHVGRIPGLNERPPKHRLL